MISRRSKGCSPTTCASSTPTGDELFAGYGRYRVYRALTRVVRLEGGFSFFFGEAEAEIERPGGGVSTRMIYTAIYRDAPEPRLFAWHSVKSSTPAPAAGP